MKLNWKKVFLYCSLVALSITMPYCTQQSKSEFDKIPDDFGPKAKYLVFYKAFQSTCDSLDFYNQKMTSLYADAAKNLEYKEIPISWNITGIWWTYSHPNSFWIEITCNSDAFPEKSFDIRRDEIPLPIATDSINSLFKEIYEKYGVRFEFKAPINSVVQIEMGSNHWENISRNFKGYLPAGEKSPEFLAKEEFYQKQINTFDLALSGFYTPEGFETPHYYATGPDGAKKAVIGEWNMYQEQAKQAEKGKKEREAILQEQAKFKNK